MCQCYEIKIVSNMKAGFRIYFFTYIVHMIHTSRSRSRSLIGIKLQHHWLWPPQCWFLSIILYNAHNNAKLMNATKIYIAKCSINNCYCTISLEPAYTYKKPEPKSLVYGIPYAEISTEALYFLYTAPEFSNQRATVVSLP
jgi:hypothetical protein